MCDLFALMAEMERQTYKDKKKKMENEKQRESSIGVLFNSIIYIQKEKCAIRFKICVGYTRIVSIKSKMFQQRASFAAKSQID